MHWIVYAMLFVDTVDTKIKACNAFNAICRSSRYKTHSHISAHNFLNIQPIFNLLESWDWGFFNHIIKYCICWNCQHKTRISNAFNAMYVDTVDTRHIHTFLPITFLIFNRFSICKKFWTAETEGFSTIPCHTMLTLSTVGISISNAFLPITFLRSHPNSFLCVCRHCQQTT